LFKALLILEFIPRFADAGYWWGGHARDLDSHVGIAGAVVGEFPAPQIPTCRVPRRQSSDAVPFETVVVIDALIGVNSAPGGRSQSVAM
jgi:hypothetical protein